MKNSCDPQYKFKNPNVNTEMKRADFRRIAPAKTPSKTFVH